MEHDHPRSGASIPRLLCRDVLRWTCGFFILSILAGIAADQEPSYNGRLLSQWLVDLQLGQVGDNPTEVAVRAMGTNAIPTLLKWISYEQSPSERSSPSEETGRRSYTLSPEERAVRTKYAFAFLGSAARPAIPELTRLARTSSGPDRAQRCADSLAYIGRESIPSLLSLATKGPPVTRRCAIDALARFAGDPAAAAVVPVLITCLDDTNKVVPIYGAAELTLLSLRLPAVVAPALTNALRSPSARTRLRVVQCLLLFEAFADTRLPSEVPAMLPAVRAAMRDPDREVRVGATNVLRRWGGWELVGEPGVGTPGTNRAHAATSELFTNAPPR